MNQPIPTIDVTVSDLESPDPSVLTVTATSSNQQLLPDGNIGIGGAGGDRTVTLTPISNVLGDATVTVTVTDTEGAFSTETFLLTVSGNTPPTVSSIDGQSIPENTATAAIPFVIGDAESDVDSLIVSVASSDTTLVPQGNLLLGGSGADRTVIATPALNQTGDATITITVADPEGLTATSSFTLIVAAGNAPPTISAIEDQQIIENTSTGEIEFTIGDAETPAGQLTLTAVSSDPNLVPDGNIRFTGTGATRQVSVTPAPDQTGAAVIVVTVADENGATASESFSLLVGADVNATVAGQVFFDDDGNGVQGPQEVGAVMIRVFADTNDNGIVDDGEPVTMTDPFGRYLLSELPAADYVIRVEPPNGQTQSSPNGFLGVAFDTSTDQTQLFDLTSDGQLRLIGTPMSEVVSDVIRTNDGELIGVGGPTARTYRIDPVTGQETLLAISAAPLAYGIAYDVSTDTIYTLAQQPGTLDTYRLHTVNEFGVLGPAIGGGLSGLTAPSDLAYDTVNDRIVGFDNFDDEFFAFQRNGSAESLSTADRPLDSFSLAFDGTRFVMFDQSDLANTLTLFVDPDTGVIQQGRRVDQPVVASGLFHIKQGDFPYRLVLNESDDVRDLDFGISRPQAAQDQDFPFVINELLLAPQSGDTDTDQFVEFRGVPGGQFNPNTYFVIVDEQNINRGEIHGIFDVSNLAFGSNGMLVLLQEGSPHQVNQESAVLRSTAPAFGGLPGDIYTDSDAANDRIDSTLVAANGYFLIQTDVQPQLGDDIDGDNDGLIDEGGIFDNWNVLDSISLHPFVGSGDQAYGQILLAEEEAGNDPASRTVGAGVPIVVGRGSGYAARIGDSVGSDPDDWTFGTVEQDQGEFRFSDFTSSLPIPFVFLDRAIDHVGESNFVGGVRGVVELLPGVGQTDSEGNPLPPQPAVGVTVLADTNGNGQRDLLDFVVDPDDGIDPDNLFDGGGVADSSAADPRVRRRHHFDGRLDLRRYADQFRGPGGPGRSVQRLQYQSHFLSRRHRFLQ